MKRLLSVIFLSLSFFLSQESTAKMMRGIDSSAWHCKTHDSRKCTTVEGFKKELKAECGAAAGNCRHRFCRANCVSWQNPKAECATYCLSHKTLVRFDIDSRRTLYTNFLLPSEWVETERHVQNLKKLKANKTLWKSSWQRKKEASLREKERQFLEELNSSAQSGAEVKARAFDVDQDLLRARERANKRAGKKHYWTDN